MAKLRLQCDSDIPESSMQVILMFNFPHGNFVHKGLVRNQNSNKCMICFLKS